MHLVLASAVVAILVLVAITVALWQYRQEVEARALLTGRAIEASVDAQLWRQFESYDAALQLVIANFSDPALRALDDDIWHRLLTNIQTSVPGIRSITILSAGGRVLSQQGASISDDYAALPFFKALKAGAGLGLLISEPFTDPEKRFTMVLSRRLATNDGQFGGVVALVVDLTSVRDILQPLPLGPLDSVVVVSDGGRIIARKPALSAVGDAGLDLSRNRNFQRMRQVGHGDYVTRSSLDGVERLISFSGVAGTRLIVSVGLATDSLYASWWRHAIMIGGLAIAISIALVVAALLLAQETRLRAAAQAELERQARTDFLTGLANRRQFEANLEREWRRAARTGADLSVVVFDADHFKQLNDLHGHAMGDEVLKLVAGVLARGARRPGDLPARIGGEEFAMLLSDTGQEEATSIAEHVRSAVWEVTLPAAEGRASVTLSAGVASASGGSVGSAAALLAAADAALYRAKEEGRNQVRVHGES